MSRRWPLVPLCFVSLFGCNEATQVAESGETASTTMDDSTDGEGPVCGNGVVEADEECDDGNSNEQDGCTSACVTGACGDGIIQPGEGCDAGADNGPGKPCTSACQPNICGDGELGPGEGCDDGNDDEDDECGNDCALATCGDKSVDPGEECDDGNSINDDDCLNTCVASACGDAVVFGEAEECDNGALNSDTAECTSACALATCGDGLVWSDQEQCDLGPNNGPTSSCLEDCIANICGDGFKGPQEGCDDGNTANDDGCSSECALEDCGDGAPQPGEECDDGNASNNDACTNACLLPACGDGFVQAGEECDAGNQNANTGNCTLACALAECGDGLVHAGVEQCDNGMANANNAACKVDCTDNFCGDGFQGPGESCDDGNASNNDACTNVCALATCGDGSVQPGEECDDDNEVNNDGCTNGCTLPACGDDIIQAGEACDDGNGNGASELCTPDCELATCGDGYVYSIGGEQCDDGNASNNDPCTNACATANCGDGYVWADQEECDDGNQNDADSCTNTCEAPACGDGLLQPGEECEDGNSLENDGCSSTCMEQRVIQIGTGESHTCALLDTGAIRCWGLGALGYGNPNTIGDNEHPFTAGDIDLGGLAIQIAAGANHSCALLDSGGVKCWGEDGSYGALGYANTNNIGDNEVPASVGIVNVGGTVAHVTAGSRFTCALLDNGSVRCWGSGGSGRLGYGNVNNIGDNEHPATAGNVNIGGTAIQISAGDAHACALLDNGAVRCWGLGTEGRLGYGNSNNIGDNELPFTAGDVNVGGTVTQISAGGQQTCALLDNGALRCWGRGLYGGLGYGNTNNIGDNELPITAGDVNVGGSVIQISSGSYHVCALLAGGSVRCWGVGTSGRLGYGNVVTIGDDELPVSVGDVSIGGTATQLDTGWSHNCALFDIGTVRCWGNGTNGFLGYANTNSIGDNELPDSVGYVQIF